MRVLRAMFEIVRYGSADFAAVIQFVEAIQEHERAAVPALKPGQEIGPIYAETLVRKVADQDGCILMAKAGGQTIGFVCAWKEVDDDALLREEMRAHAFISDIFVVEDWRGRGVAAGLLSAIEAAMLERGSTQVRVCAKSTNALATGSYNRAGYRAYEIIFWKSLGKYAKAGAMRPVKHKAGKRYS
jgi:ribosomal protein S18 acetylase RimI-like enzyme